MRKHHRTPGSRRAAALIWSGISLLVAAPMLIAHIPGANLQSPLTAVAFSPIDGTIDAASGPERTGAAAVCTAMRIHTVRTAANLYLAVDVPELVANPDDVLLLYFDMNHNAGTTPDAADRAIRLSQFPAGLNQTPAIAEIYSGNGTDWVAPAAFATVKSSRTAGGRLVVELTVPITAAPVGFALFYASMDLQDCNVDFDFSESAFKWPSGLATPGGDNLAGVKDPSQWGDVGRRAPVVTFNAPTCCSPTDIIYSQSSVTYPEDLDQGQPVNIHALVHNTDATFQAKNVKVEFRVHKFGTGAAVFPTIPPTQEIPVIGTSAAATTSDVQWTPTAPMHGCIQAEILAPIEGGGKSLDDYSIGGANTLAQYNIDVECLPKGSKKAMQFTTFNPHATKAQTITLVKHERIPKGFEGLRFELQQPTRALAPREEMNVALLVTTAANLPTTDLPRQMLHVPPTAGRTSAVAIQARPGDRLHISATGDVDIDAGGGAPSTGPDGIDVSKTVRGQFLLRGENGARVGGALIASFDGFETSFLLGADTTITIPERQGLSLAVNDVVEGHTDNTGRGFDVEVWTLSQSAPPIPAGAAPAATAAPVAAAAEPRFPEVKITAIVIDEVTIAGKVYKIVTALGAVTYQILVSDMAAPPPPTEPGKPGYLVWVLLLIVLGVIAVIFLRRKRKKA